MPHVAVFANRSRGQFFKQEDRLQKLTTDSSGVGEAVFEDLERETRSLITYNPKNETLSAIALQLYTSRLEKT